MQTVLIVAGGLVAGYLIGRLFARPAPPRYVRVQLPPVDGTLPPPGESARKAAESIGAFGALVDRLAARGIAVYDVACEPGTWWRLVVRGGAGREEEVTRVSWRAGDQDLRVATSVLVAHLAPSQWRGERGLSIGPDGDPLRTAEEFIVERFAKGARRNRFSRP